MKNPKHLDTHQDYAYRLNLVFNYIDEHYQQNLNLESLAEIASFSPYHFHRIFKFITKETINNFIVRKRLEKSVADLIHKKLPITETAYKNGFDSVAAYSKSFKKYYGLSPRNFIKNHPYKYQKISIKDSNIGQINENREQYLCLIEDLKNWIKMNSQIEIKKLDKMDLAFINCIGSHELGNSYQKLMAWASQNQLLNKETKMLTIIHDSFKITPANKVRMSACIVLNKAMNLMGEINHKTIEPGKYIVGSFVIALEEFEKAWTSLFIWMNENKHTKSNRDPLEIYYNDYTQHPEKKCIVDLCIPID